MRRLLTTILGMLFLFNYGQEKVRLDLVLRANSKIDSNLRYYLYNDIGQLLSSKKLRNNTTIFLSREKSEKFTLNVMKGSDLIRSWKVLSNDLEPGNTIQSNYFFSNNSSLDSAVITTHRKFSTINGRIPITDQIIETTLQPKKGFGARNRGWLKYQNQKNWVSDFGFGMSDDIKSGKSWIYSRWSFDNKWYGIVVEKNFLWINYVIILKPGSKPKNPSKGMIYMDLNEDLWHYKKGVWRKLLDDSFIDTIINNVN